MKKFLLRLLGLTNQQSAEEVIIIEKNKPLPIKKVKYSDLLRITDTFEKLPINGSFPISNELDYAARKIAKEHFPEYKITIRSMGTTKRVFRKA